MKNTPFGFDKPEDSPGFLLWQTTMSWQRCIKKALEPFEISHAQFVMMAILLWFQSKHKTVLQTDLINLSKLDKMTVSKALKKLAALNLIQRQENIHDTRAKTVLLTTSGVLLAKKLVPLVETIDAEFFNRLQNEEQQFFISALQKLVE